ncbi:hypothetical protein ES703_30054 [subsurface metagenome]
MKLKIKRGNWTEKIGVLVMFGLFGAIGLLIPSQIISPPGLLQPGPSLGYSPRLFPYIIVVFAIIMSLCLLIKSFISISSVVGEEEGGADIKVKGLLRAAGVIAILAIYILLFNFLGYILTTLLTLVALMWYFGISFRKEWKVAVPVFVLTPAIIYYVFKMLLYVALPPGILKELLYRIGLY